MIKTKHLFLFCHNLLFLLLIIALGRARCVDFDGKGKHKKGGLNGLQNAVLRHSLTFSVFLYNSLIFSENKHKKKHQKPPFLMLKLKGKGIAYFL